MAARIGLSATSSYSGPVTDGVTGRSTGAAAAAAAGAVDAASTSRRTMRPPGPLPWMSLRSTPDCAAIFLASGEAFTRPPSPLGRVWRVRGCWATTSCTRWLPGASGPFAGAGLRAAGSSLLGCGGTAAGRSAMSGLAPLGAAASLGAFASLAGFAPPSAAGAPPPACPTTELMSSFASAMTPMSEPTGTVLPADTRILRSTPAPNASISTSALSVSTSARMSPLCTRSPSFLSHLMTLPLSICSDSFGITTLVTAMSAAPVGVADTPDRVRDLLFGRRLRALEVARVRHRRLRAGDAQHGRIEVIEGFLGDLGGYLRAHAREAGAGLDHDRAMGLTDRPDDRLGIERLKRPRVHDLHRDALFRQLLRGLHRAIHHAHVGDDGDVGALAPHDRLAEGNGEVRVLRHLALHVVEGLGLDEDDRIVVADGRLQQALGVHRRGGAHDLQPRHVVEVHLHRLRVLRGELVRGAARPADHDRHVVLAARHVVQLRGRVDDLVQGEQREVEGHHLDHGTQPHHGRADADAGEARLRDRRVDDPLGPELLEQTLGDLVGALVEADLLADDEDVGIALELLPQREVQGLAIRHHRHSGALLEDVGEELGRRRLRRGIGERHRLVHEVVDVLLDLLDVVVREHPGLEGAVAEEDDRVAQLLALDLLLGAVHGSGRIPHAVTAEAVRAHLEQRRRLVAPRALDRAPHGVTHGHDVHAVHRLGRDAVRLAELPDLRLGQRALQRGAHRVAVVLAEPDDGQLPEGREVQGLVELALGHRAIAEVAHDHLVPPAVLDREAHAGGDRQVGADDGVTAEEVVLLVEQVHRAALALAEPVDAAEQLGHHATRVGALDETVAVLAVGRDRVVVAPEHRGGAGGHRLLADREVQEPADLAERVRLRRLLLEPADEDHVAQKLAREVGVDPEPRRRLLSHHLGHALPPALYSISLPDITGSPRPSNGLRLARLTQTRLARRTACGSHVSLRLASPVERPAARTTTS